MFRKAMPVATAVAALAIVAMAPVSAASASAVTISVQRAHVETVKEWRSNFTCPTNQVLTGRSHYGDENADTTYSCSFIFINGEQVRVSLLDWSTQMKEKDSFYEPTLGSVAIAGRMHTGDENGMTRYRPATLFWQGRQVQLISKTWSGIYKENNHSWTAGHNQVMTGRLHLGDENGKTQYQYSTVTFAG